MSRNVYYSQIGSGLIFLLTIGAFLFAPLMQGDLLAKQGGKKGKKKWPPNEVFPEYPMLETLAIGKWWEQKPSKAQPMPLNVPRDQVCAFAVYTHDRGTLKLTAQMFPLMPDESKEARLEFKQSDGSWKEVAKEKIVELGWSAHFRLKGWDNSKGRCLPCPTWRESRI